MCRLAMQHLECAALGIEVGSTHPQEHTSTGELGMGMEPQLAPDQCAHGPYAARGHAA
jgi:hypothetical protein